MTITVVLFVIPVLPQLGASPHNFKTPSEPFTADPEPSTEAEPNTEDHETATVDLRPLTTTSEPFPQTSSGCSTTIQQCLLDCGGGVERLGCCADDARMAAEQFVDELVAVVASKIDDRAGTLTAADDWLRRNLGLPLPARRRIPGD